jgi:hypothetical protein
MTATLQLSRNLLDQLRAGALAPYGVSSRDISATAAVRHRPRNDTSAALFTWAGG